jgi:hypothetical protein
MELIDKEALMMKPKYSSTISSKRRLFRGCVV